ncbi:MAG TPA: OmpH family outer membrane protein [Firmicutes bacterium]|nr:OmpH family outer membrane protein [Bacillota bacterium]
MRRQTLGIMLVLLIALLVPAMASASTIGYVDFEFLFYSHPEYDAKNADLQLAAEELYVEIEEEAAKLSTQEEIDELIAGYEWKFEQIEQQVRLDLVTFILEIIETVAAAHNIETVLPESSVIYGGVNLTAPVIEAMYGSYGISVPSAIRELLQ